jgi:hypothetical protein
MDFLGTSGSSVRLSTGASSLSRLLWISLSTSSPNSSISNVGSYNVVEAAVGRTVSTSDVRLTLSITEAFVACEVDTNDEEVIEDAVTTMLETLATTLELVLSKLFSKSISSLKPGNHFVHPNVHITNPNPLSNIRLFNTHPTDTKKKVSAASRISRSSQSDRSRAVTSILEVSRREVKDV